MDFEVLQKRRWSMLGQVIGSNKAEYIEKKDFVELRELSDVLSHFSEGDFIEWGITSASWQLLAISGYPQVDAGIIKEIADHIAQWMHPAARSSYPSPPHLREALLTRLANTRRIMAIEPIGVNRPRVLNVLIEFLLSHVYKVNLDKLAASHGPTLATLDRIELSDEEEPKATADDMLLEILTMFRFDQLRELVRSQGGPDAFDWGIPHMIMFPKIMLLMAESATNTVKEATKLVFGPEVQRIAKRYNSEGKTGCLINLSAIILASATLVGLAVAILK